MNKTTLLIAGLLTLACIPLKSSEETENTARLADILNSTYSMYDWSETLLKREIAKNPEDVDLLKVQLASTYFKSNKEEEGNKIIAEVKAESKFYPDAQKALGLVMLGKGKIDEATKFLDAYRNFYLAKYKDTLPTASEMKRFEMDMGYLILIHRDQKPNVTKLIETMDNIVSLKNRIRAQQIKDADINEDLEEAESPDESMLFTNMSVLDILERRKADGGTVEKKDIEPVAKSLEKLYWSNAVVRDLAAMQNVRAHLLVGDLKTTKKILDQFKENIDVWETPDENGESPFSGADMAQSPKAPYRHFLGVYCKLNAAAMTDDAAKKKELGRALNYLYACLKTNEGYTRSQDVLIELLQVNDELEKMTGKKPLPLDNPVIAKLMATGAVSEKADRDYRDKKYKEVIPQLISGYARAPHDERAKDALIMIADCYSKLGQDIEAAAVAELLATRWPRAEEVANLLLSVGVTTWKTAADMKEDTPAKRALTDDSVKILNTFLELFAGHQSAPDIANLIAQDAMKRARAIAETGIKTADIKEKLALFDHANATYIDAAQKYERIVKHFAQKKQIVSNAYYYMGSCYSSASDFVKSNDAFRKFCELETADLDKLATAKFLIADNFYRDATALGKEAKELLVKASKLGEEDAAKVTTDANQKLTASKAAYLNAAKEYTDFTGPFFEKTLKGTNEPKIKTRMAMAKELIAWSYDGAEDKKTAIKAFDDYLKSPYNNKETEKRAPAALSRMAILYAEVGDAKNAAKYLEELVAKYPKSNEGKDALFILGRSMYAIKSYEKSIEAFERMFKESKAVNVPAWQWILANMVEYPDSQKPVTPAMAKIAIDAGTRLLTAIDRDMADKKKPNGRDWFSEAALKSFNGDPVKILDNLYMTQERIWLNIAKAYFLAEKYKESCDTLDKLITPPKNEGLPPNSPKYVSPYLYDAWLLRADARAKNKDEKGAHEDMSKMISQTGFANRFDRQRQAICKDADIYIAAKKYKNALDVLSPLVDNEDLKVRAEVKYPANMTPSQKIQIEKEAEDLFQAELQYIEYAAYRYAWCAAILGLKDQAQMMTSRYKKNFGTGRFGHELERLPAPEAANKP